MSDLSPIPTAYCTRCGAELEPGAKFCPNCGQATETPAPVFAPPPAPVATNPYSAPTPRYTYAAPVETGGGIGKLFSGSGRIGRLEWFLTILGVWVLLIVAWVIIIGVDKPGVTILLGLSSLALAMVVAICAGVKRLHDFDQSGWLYLLMLVPVVSFIFLLVLLVAGPTSGQNRYGFEDSGSVMG